MKKRFILTGFSGMLLGVALTSLGFRVLAPQGVQAQAPQAAPEGSQPPFSGEAGVP